MRNKKKINKTKKNNNYRRNALPRKRAESANRTRYVPLRTLPIDKVLSREELEYFWSTYGKNGITDEEYFGLGHIAVGESGRQIISPKGKNRRTIRELVGSLILQLPKDNEQPKELYFYDSGRFGAKLNLQNPLLLTQNNMKEIPVFLAYRDALAAAQGETRIKAENLNLKNNERNITQYQGRRNHTFNNVYNL